MVDDLKVTLVKKLNYRRIHCTCGVAVMPTDPTPELTEAVKSVAREFGAQFRIMDTTVHPETVLRYHIRVLPVVVIMDKAYPADVEIIKEVLAGHTR